VDVGRRHGHGHWRRETVGTRAGTPTNGTTGGTPERREGARVDDGGPEPPGDVGRVDGGAEERPGRERGAGTVDAGDPRERRRE
jgi:hypothetical protein